MVCFFSIFCSGTTHTDIAGAVYCVHNLTSSGTSLCEYAGRLSWPPTGRPMAHRAMGPILLEMHRISPHALEAIAV